MKKLTRRNLLTQASGAGLAVLLANSDQARGDEPKAKPGPKRELFVIGPYLLGEWYKKAPKEHLVDDWFLKGAGITNDDVVKALNKNRVFLIDQRIGDDPKKLRFAEMDYPTAVIDGELVHEWENAKNRVFTIRITELNAPGWSIASVMTPATRTLSGVQFFLQCRGDFGRERMETIAA